MKIYIFFLSFFIFIGGQVQSQGYYFSEKVMDPSPFQLDINWSSHSRFAGNMKIVGTQLFCTSFGDDLDANDTNALNNAGSVFAYKKFSGQWQFEQKLTAPVRHAGSAFGSSVVSIDSFLFVSAKSEEFDENELNPIGSAGAVYVFKLDNSGDWVFYQKLVASNRSLNGLSAANFGSALCANSNALFVSSKAGIDSTNSNFLNSSGLVYEFQQNASGVWQEISMINSPVRHAQDFFGSKLDANDTLLVIGAIGDDYDDNNLNFLNKAGAIFVYKKNSAGQWVFDQKVVSDVRNAFEEFGVNFLIHDNLILALEYETFPYNYEKRVVVLKSTFSGYDLEQEISPNYLMTPLSISNVNSAREEVLLLNGDSLLISLPQSNRIEQYKISNDSLQLVNQIDFCLIDSADLGGGLEIYGENIIAYCPWDRSQDSLLYGGYYPGAFAEFEKCTSPELTGLSADSLVSCNGDITLYVGPNSSLSNATAWGLYYGIQTDSLLATSATGEFITTLTETGWYTVKAIGGCNQVCGPVQSFYFELNPIPVTNESIFICDSDFIFNQWITSDTIIFDTLQNLVGCDSVIQNNVSVFYTVNSSDTVYGNDSLFYMNTMFYTSTVFDSTFLSAAECDSIITYVVIIDSTLMLSAQRSNEIFGNDGAIDLSIYGGQPPYAIDWNNDEEGDFDDTEDLDGLVAGTYTVVVRDALNATAELSVVIENQLSISEPLEVSSISIYPNPTKQFFSVESSNTTIQSIEIVDLLGKSVLVLNNLNSNIQNVDLSHAQSGMYLIKIVDSEHQVQLKRIVKN